MQMAVVVPPFRTTPRPTRLETDTIVFHATAGASLASDVRALHAEGYGYHYLIDRDGTVYKGAPTSMSVAHAGKSVGPQGESCNRYSVGVSFCNRNDNIEKITPAQIGAAVKLCIELASALPIKWITTHRLITMDPVRKGRSRKVDPRLFDLDAMSKATGIPFWEPWTDARLLPY